jgi:hypothetical protein
MFMQRLPFCPQNAALHAVALPVCSHNHQIASQFSSRLRSEKSISQKAAVAGPPRFLSRVTPSTNCDGLPIEFAKHYFVASVSRLLCDVTRFCSLFHSNQFWRS